MLDESATRPTYSSESEIAAPGGSSAARAGPPKPSVPISIAPATSASLLLTARKILLTRGGCVLAEVGCETSDDAGPPNLPGRARERPVLGRVARRGSP